MNKKKTFTILGVVIGVLAIIVLIIVFFVLPTCFASSESEIKEMQKTNVDSLISVDIPDEPDVPATAESDMPASTESDAPVTADTDSLNK